MDDSMIEIKNELIEWIENTFDLEILQKMMDLKNEAPSIILEINSEKLVENDFDEQFAAGMNSEELLENIAEHIQSINLEEPSSVVSGNKAEYVVKDDFDERFANGLTLAESRKRTKEFISTLPWKK